MSDQHALKDQLRRALDSLEMVIRSAGEYDEAERDDTVRAVRRLVGTMRTKRQKLASRVEDEA